MRNDIQDLIIIGAGPIGLACGIEAQKKGLDHLIFDKGCLVNSLYRYPMNMTFFSTSDKLEIGDVPFISHNTKPTRTEALEYYRRVTSHWKLPLRLYEKTTKVHRQGGLFNVITEKSNYQSRKIIIATGFYDFPYLLNVPGEQLSKVPAFSTLSDQELIEKVFEDRIITDAEHEAVRYQWNGVV